jgi:2-polyprenyl-3-methyl-5-hydroxy-6-metoxy-1,4-benzoquinol methylase
MSPRCPLCQLSHTEPLGKRSDFDGFEMYEPYVVDLQRFDSEIVECRTCGLQFIHPMYEDSELAELYNQPRYKKFLAMVDDWFDFDSIDPQFRLQQSREKFLLAGVDSWLKEHHSSHSTKPTCLDIGCGRGHNMAVLDQMGFDVEGIDLSEIQIEYVREHYGFRVRRIALEDLESTDKYDCIVATNFIEHVRHPHAFMAKVATFLKPDGLLLIETPLSIIEHIDQGHTKERRYCDIYHTLFFDHLTLALLGAMHGLEYVSSTDTVFRKLEFTHIDMVVCFRPSESRQDLRIPWELTKILRTSHNSIEAEYLKWVEELRTFQPTMDSPLFLVKTLGKWFRKHGVSGTFKGFVNFLRDHYHGKKL